MYIQRYLPHLPAGGEIVIFDRSWYNRAGVERVMGFCTEEQAKRFLDVVPKLKRRSSTPALPAQVLARGEPARTNQAPYGAQRRRREDLEAIHHGPEVVRPLG